MSSTLAVLDGVVVVESSFCLSKLICCRRSLSKSCSVISGVISIFFVVVVVVGGFVAAELIEPFVVDAAAADAAAVVGVSVDGFDPILSRFSIEALMFCCPP